MATPDYEKLANQANTLSDKGLVERQKVAKSEWEWHRQEATRLKREGEHVLAEQEDTIAKQWKRVFEIYDEVVKARREQNPGIRKVEAEVEEERAERREKQREVVAQIAKEHSLSTRASETFWGFFGLGSDQTWLERLKGGAKVAAILAIVTLVIYVLFKLGSFGAQTAATAMKTSLERGDRLARASIPGL